VDLLGVKVLRPTPKKNNSRISDNEIIFYRTLLFFLSIYRL